MTSLYFRPVNLQPSFGSAHDPQQYRKEKGDKAGRHSSNEGPDRNRVPVTDETYDGTGATHTREEHRRRTGQ